MKKTIVCLLLSLYFISCGPSKKSVSTDTTSEKSSFDSAGWIKQKSEELNTKYFNWYNKRIDEYNKAAEMNVYFNEPVKTNDCPDDSIIVCPPCDNEIEVKADGSFKAKGNLKGFSNKTNEQRIIIDSSAIHSLDSALKVIEKERGEKITAQQELKQEKSKVVVKKWPWFLWFCLGAVSMLAALFVINVYLSKRKK